MVQPKPAEKYATLVCLLLLLAGCLLAFWPVSLGLFSLKNDALNYFLPVRHLVSESIFSGHWPFWSPYFNLGYPLHGDMQSGVWNPVVQLFSIFGPYTLRTLQWETLLYVYLSGVGMFFLVRHFTRQNNISLLAGFAFMLCGFNSDSAQFLNWITSASYLPFCFLFYYRTLAEKKLSHAIAFAIFFYLMFVSAYPADFILSGYLFLAVLVWWLWQAVNRKKIVLTHALKLHLFIAVIFVLLSLPAIISYAEFLQLTERGSGAVYQDVMSNPLHPLLVFSYATPLPVWKASFAEITDPLERNSFFGLISFALLILAFLTKTPDRLFRFFKWAFVMSLLFSFGVYGGIRIVAYYVLPLMNTFRHPANARLFTIFAACVLAALSLAYMSKNESAGKRKTVFYSLAGIFLILLSWSLAGDFSLFDKLINVSGAAGMKALLDQLNFSELLAINVVLQIPFLLALYFFFVKKVNLKWLVWMGIANSIMHTMLVQPFTVVKKDTVAAIQQVLDKVQQPGYPVPDLKRSPAENSVEGEKYFDEIGVANLYNKKIGRVDYRVCPNNLLTQNEFWFNAGLRERLMQLPLFYRADTILRTQDSATAKKFTGTLAFLLNAAEHTTSSGEWDGRIEKFTPNEWQISISSSTTGYYALFQNDYPRWQLQIDGEEKKIDRANVSFMGFAVPAGQHEIKLSYRSTDLRIAFYVSLATLLLSLLIVAFYEKRSRYTT
ncbi:MAG: hypothetical protein ACO1OO_05805 [Flavisolibacter sp.]